MQTAKTILGILSQKSIANPDFRFNRLYRLLYNIDFYWNAYSKVSSEGGNLTKETEKRLEELIDAIRTEKYYPILNPSFSDNLIQEIIREILESIYEPSFSVNSHGFRPNRSCHTALFQIKENWEGAKWIIKGKITNFLAGISHKKLLQILSRRIDDNRFLRLIIKFFKAGYMETPLKYETYSGTARGGILTSILANIYFNEFDKFMEKLCVQYSFGKERKKNPLYNKLNCKHHYYLKKGQMGKARELRIQRDKIQFFDQMDRTFSRVRYCRYADNFVIGIWNDKITAQKIKDYARNFLAKELLIELNQEDTIIINLKDSTVNFLGYEISKFSRHKGKAGYYINESIQLLVPTNVVNRYIAKYCSNGKAIHLPQRVNQSELDTVKQYNAEIRGLYNYYFLAEDVSKKINKVRHYNYDSMVKTLAFKHKCSYKAIIEKFGVDVQSKERTGKLIGIKHQTSDGERIMTYFNRSLSKRKGLD